MLAPRKVKHRKWFKGRLKGIATSRNKINYGTYALKALGNSWVTARQIESARRAMTRFVKRGGKIWIRVFPHKPISAKPLEVGMGGGKGALSHFVAVVKPGTIVYEMSGVDEDVAREAMRLAGRKLPVKTKFIRAEDRK